MFQQMADGYAATSEPAAERAVERLVEMAADVRGCAILDRDGEVLAASNDAEWAKRAGELWGAAGEGGGAPPNQIHVATDVGEVFAVRPRDGASAIVVSGRFALESLMFCDLRAALRELEAELERTPA